MTEAEKRQILKEDRDVRGTERIILGTDLKSGHILSILSEPRLNRNIVVCDSQGSMKSRACARNMILQCVRSRESMFITDPKSELCEDTAVSLRAEGHIVRQWNLTESEHTDAWDCLGKNDGGLIYFY